MSPPLDEVTLVTAIMETRQQVDFLWQFFVTVQLAVFALLLIYDEAVESMSILGRAFAAIGVGMFNYVNGNALQSTYRLLDAAIDQYQFLYGQAERFRPAFYELFVNANFADRPDLVKVTHGTAMAIVVLALLSSSFIQSKKKKS
jgi:hypothetical protein